MPRAESFNFYVYRPTVEVGEGGGPGEKKKC